MSALVLTFSLFVFWRHTTHTPPRVLCVCLSADSDSAIAVWVGLDMGGGGGGHRVFERERGAACALINFVYSLLLIHWTTRVPERI
jgi:hypothetical protein